MFFFFFNSFLSFFIPLFDSSALNISLHPSENRVTLCTVIISTKLDRRSPVMWNTKNVWNVTKGQEGLLMSLNPTACFSIFSLFCFFLPLKIVFKDLLKHVLNLVLVSQLRDVFDAAKYL